MRRWLHARVSTTSTSAARASPNLQTALMAMSSRASSERMAPFSSSDASTSAASRCLRAARGRRLTGGAPDGANGTRNRGRVGRRGSALMLGGEAACVGTLEAEAYSLISCYPTHSMRLRLCLRESRACMPMQPRISAMATGLASRRPLRSLCSHRGFAGDEVDRCSRADEGDTLVLLLKVREDDGPSTAVGVYQRCEDASMDARVADSSRQRVSDHYVVAISPREFDTDVTAQICHDFKATEAPPTPTRAAEKVVCVAARSAEVGHAGYQLCY